MRIPTWALLASLVAVPACCMRPQTTHLRMSASAGATVRTPIVVYEQVTIASPSEGPPAQEITVVDLMPYIHSALEASGMRDGSVNLISRHTTTAITINEWESRLVRDIRAWLLRLAPPDDRSAVGEASAGVAYLHNDINTRPESEARRFVSGLRRPRVALLTPRPGRPAPSSRSPAPPLPQDEKQRCLDNGWEVDDPDELQRWRDQEPINAHSHLAAMLLRQPVDSAVLAVPQLRPRR